MPAITTSETKIEPVRHRTLSFTPEAWDKIWALTEACPVEISAIGIVAENDPNLVEDFFVVKQKCSAVRTELDPEELQKLTMTLDSIGVSPGRMRVWWHSHVNMATDLSGTDYDNIRRYASAFLWSIVTNKHDAARVRAGMSPVNLNIQLDTFDPKDETNQLSPLRSTTTKCGWAVRRVNEFEEWAREQVAEKVEQLTVPSGSANKYASQYAGRYPATTTTTLNSGGTNVPAWVHDAANRAHNISNIPEGANDIVFKDEFVDSAYGAGFLTRGEAISMAATLQRKTGSTCLEHAKANVPGSKEAVAELAKLVENALRSFAKVEDRTALRAAFSAYLSARGFDQVGGFDDHTLGSSDFMGIGWLDVKDMAASAVEKGSFGSVAKIIYASVM